MTHYYDEILSKSDPIGYALMDISRVWGGGQEQVWQGRPLPNVVQPAIALQVPGIVNGDRRETLLAAAVLEEQTSSQDQLVLGVVGTCAITGAATNRLSFAFLMGGNVSPDWSEIIRSSAVGAGVYVSFVQAVELVTARYGTRFARFPPRIMQPVLIRRSAGMATEERCVFFLFSCVVRENMSVTPSTFADD